jgi:SH3-like domain-containing protein
MAPERQECAPPPGIIETHGGIAMRRLTWRRESDGKRRFGRRRKTANAFFAVGLGLALAGLASAGSSRAQEVGPVSKLALPRYVSLKSDRVNLREGPSKDHRTIWIFERAGLPVEITAEFDTWRKVRDSEGAEGWVLHSLLSGRRTALVAPWKKGATLTLYSKPNEDASPVARLQSGVIGNIDNCNHNWCKIYGDGFDGYMQQGDLWGVYPNETVP